MCVAEILADPLSVTITMAVFAIHDARKTNPQRVLAILRSEAKRSEQEALLPRIVYAKVKRSL